MFDAAFCHIGLQTQDQIVDDTIAILHDSCANLHITASQLDELQSVLPVLDASYAAIFDVFHDGILHHRQDMA